MTKRAIRLILSALLVVSALAACGEDAGDDSGDDGDSATTGAPETTAPSEEGPGDAGDGPGFGEAIEASVTLSGAVEQTYTPGPDTSFIVAGGCQGEQFGIQIQINDDTPRTVAQVLTGVERDLSGGETGTFDVDTVRVEIFEEGLQSTDYDGTGTLEIIEHEAPDDLNERRMMLTVSGEDLEGGDGALDVEAHVTWVMGCP